MLFNYILCLLLMCIMGFFIGYYFGKILDKKSIHGIIIVDDVEESYFFQMNSEDIKNPKYKKIIFNIEHKHGSQK